MHLITMVLLFLFLFVKRLEKLNLLKRSYKIWLVLLDSIRLTSYGPSQQMNIKKNTLYTWLNRLSCFLSFKQRNERHKVLTRCIASYLMTARMDTDFRNIFFATILGASDTCGDRIINSILNIGIAHKIHTLPKEEYKQLAKFIGNTVWPIMLLQTVAHEKIKTLRFFDEIETYLAYPIKLKKELGLEIDVQEMLYFEHWSNVTDEDLRNAKSFVLNHTQNKAAYCQYLDTNDKWVEVVKEHKAEEVEKANLKRYEDYDEKAYLATLAGLTEQLLGDDFFTTIPDGA